MSTSLVASLTEVFFFTAMGLNTPEVPYANFTPEDRKVAEEKLTTMKPANEASLKKWISHMGESTPWAEPKTPDDIMVTRTLMKATIHRCSQFLTTDGFTGQNDELGRILQRLLTGPNAQTLLDLATHGRLPLPDEHTRQAHLKWAIIYAMRDLEYKGDLPSKKMTTAGKAAKILSERARGVPGSAISTSDLDFQAV